MDALVAVSRWLHFAGVAILLGGIFYGRVVAKNLSGFKVWAYVAIGVILVSGVVNLVSKPSIPPHYYVWLGIKVLLALHIFGATLSYRGKLRSLTGALIAAAVVLGISEVLRSLSLP